jgi:hypothetical protein
MKLDMSITDNYASFIDKRKANFVSKDLIEFKV